MNLRAWNERRQRAAAPARRTAAPGPWRDWAPTPLTLAVALASAAVLLTGCASPGAAHAPLASTSAQQLGLAADAPAVAIAPDALALGDARLAELLRQAQSAHPNLAAAQARVARAQALAGLSQAASGPQVNASAEVMRQHYTANGLVPKPVAGNDWNSGTLQMGAAWAPDFFGQHSAELASAVGQARAAQAERAAVANALGQQVARAYVLLARQVSQAEVLAQVQAQREDILALTRQRVDAGLDDRLALSPAEVALEEVRQQRAALADQTALTRHQLATLCGLAPQALEGLSPPLAGLNLPSLPEQLGADLLGRRPDVAAARWRAEAATQEVGAARAQFYPNINLSAFVGLNALGLDNLLQGSSRQWGVAPALRLPVFDGGRLRAQLGARQAEQDAAIAQYNAQVLDAAREATDALGSLHALPAQQNAQARAQASAEGAWALARQRHRAGLGGRLAELNAQNAVLAQRQQALNLQAQRLELGVALIKALGGGWVDDTAAAPQAVAAARP